VNHRHVAGSDWITTLITAGAPTVAALGAVGLGSRYTTRRDERRAEQAREEAQAAQRRDAYAGLVTAASALLRVHRQLRTAYALNRSGDPDMEPFRARLDADSGELGRAVAVVMLVGSDAAREGAKAIADRARESSEIFSCRAIALMQAGPRRERRLPAFDTAAAERAHDQLDEAVEAFIDAVRPGAGIAPQAGRQPASRRNG
jgi:hypothetical protein